MPRIQVMSIQSFVKSITPSSPIIRGKRGACFLTFLVAGRSCLATFACGAGGEPGHPFMSFKKWMSCTSSRDGPFSQSSSSSTRSMTSIFAFRRIFSFSLHLRRFVPDLRGHPVLGSGAGVGQEPGRNKGLMCPRACRKSSYDPWAEYISVRGVCYLEICT